VLNPDRATNVLIAKVACATTAAPTYFQHANLRGEKFVDGGLGNNNPSWIAYFEVIQMHQLHRHKWRLAHQIVGQNPTEPPVQQTNAVGVLVSIGTGKTKQARLVGPAGVSRYLGYVRLTRQMATNAEDIHQRMSNTTGTNGTRYHRFNVQTGLEDVKLDEWQTSRDEEGGITHVTLQKIETETRAYLQSPGVMDEIRECAGQLVELRNAANVELRNAANR
jgi:patatin-like phospholipase/acyl hydrolase